MESSDDSAPSSPAQVPGATRRSRRVVNQPKRFGDAPNAPTKRKRGGNHDEEDEEAESPDEEELDDSDEEDEDDGGADEEPAQRTKKSSRKARPRKPAAKKPKINGAGPVTHEHGASLPSRPKKTVRIEVSRDNANWLYAAVFSSGDSSDDVVASWYQKYQQGKSTAVMDLVNFLLLAAGCDGRVTQDDIEDPDNCQNRLADLQSVYQEGGIADYPWISRAKSGKAFRDLLTGFFKSLINVMHETEVLYTDEVLMENIARWVVSMSSSTLRPFRHTATAAVLAMQAALVDVTGKLDDRITRLTQQIDAEKGRKTKTKNNERLSAFQDGLKQANKNREICQEQIRDFFDTVFVLRYRDIDQKIRAECMEGIGHWIWDLPTVFNDPQYLRYLGWMLSDVGPQTRHEVLKQLAKLFKRDGGKMGSFIDRFKPRITEMALVDQDAGVRVTAIVALEVLRATGMLEPDEVDTVGKLIFDSDGRVRKASVDFFSHCLQDQIDRKTEEIGSETVEELFAESEEDDFSSPRREWIGIKCLAETLAAYDAQLEEATDRETHPHLNIDEQGSAAAKKTRITLASESLYEKMEVVRNWEVLAGYLLYDHSASAKSNSRSKARSRSNEAAFSNAVAPEGEEELIILEVLATAVKQSLSQASENDKSKKKQVRQEAAETQEQTAVHLAITIPKLLKKFGAEPNTATTVLQLEHFLDLDIFRHLRQDTSTYTKLIEEICIQFDRHVDKGVLNAATQSLLHACRYEELREATDARISTLWENSIKLLRNFDRECELAIRGNLAAQNITQLGYTLAKISKLASISDCVDVLEAEGNINGSTAPAIDILVKTIYRGKIEQVDEELDDLEDEAVAFDIRACQFYFLWKVKALKHAMRAQANIPHADVDHVSVLRGTFSRNLINTLTSRGVNDDLRLFATGALCDLHVSMESIRLTFEQVPARHDAYRSILVLTHPIDPRLVPELIEIFDVAERAYAKRAQKTLNEPAEDEDPVDDDQFLDDEDEEGLTEAERKAREVAAENTLCDLASKLVMAIMGHMLDERGPDAGKLRKRMLRNQNKLGHNFKEVVSFLDEDKLLEHLRPKKIAQTDKGKRPAAKQAASEAIIVADEEDDPFAEPEPEEGTVEDLRRRELLDEDPFDEPEGGDEDDAADNRMDDDILGD